MATVCETFSRCDVYGGIKGVKTYTIEVRNSDSVGVWLKTCDLSPKALDRLKRGLERMTTACKRKGKK